MEGQSTTADSIPSQRSTRPAINQWFIAGSVTIAAFMELLDTSIANVALPHVGGGLGRSYDEVTWILTTYLVANAVVLPMTAWLSRLLGRKNVPKQEENGLSPTLLFQRVFICPADHYVIFDPH